jgi:hypothetical protein
MNAQAAQAAQVAAAQAEALRQAKEAMRASGATCETDCRRSDRTYGRCEVPAVGRCAGCHRPFCESHQSENRSDHVGGSPVRRFASLAECYECQDREFTREVTEAREAHERAEAGRQKERKRSERERRQHAAKVAAREAETGWARAEIRVARLSPRIGKLEPRNPATFGQAVAAALVGVIDLLLLATMWGGMAAGDSERAVLGLLGLLLLLWPTVWTVGILVKLMRQQLRRSYIRERDELLLARGCGDPTCGRCG